MKIALFTETFLPKIDGIVTRLRNTAVALQKCGHEVLVFAPGDGPAKLEGIPVEGIPGIQFPLYPELTLSFPRAYIRQKLLEFSPDIVHVADPTCLGVAGIYYSDVLALPLILSYHTRLPQYLHHYKLGALEPAIWKVMRMRHSRAQLNLCTSTVMAEELTANGIERVRLWPKAVDVNQFHPSFASDDMRRWLSQGHPQDPLFLYVGRLSPEKGIQFLRCLFRGVPNARLAIVGGGPIRKELETHFAGTATFFAGYLTGERLAEAMASASALVLPSKTETLGLVLMEAMAAETVVIGANAGGIPDVIENGENGFLFQPDSEEDFVRIAQRVANGECEEIRRNARRDAQGWSWESATKTLVGFYETARQMPRFEKSAHAHTPWMLAMKRAAIGGMKIFLR